MNIKSSVLDTNSRTGMVMCEKKLEWRPPGRRKRRPRNSWMQEIKTGMREKGIDDMEWIDREEWGRKIEGN